MPHSWLESPSWTSVRKFVREGGASLASLSAAVPLWWGVTLLLVVLAFALESPLLFVVAVVQAGLLMLARPDVGSATEPAQFAIAESWGSRLPSAVACRRAATISVVVAYRVAFRAAACLLITVTVAAGALAWFVLQDAELWRWTALQTEGPPLGPLLVTGAAGLAALLTSGWIACRLPLLPRPAAQFHSSH